MSFYISAFRLFNHYFCRTFVHPQPLEDWMPHAAICSDLGELDVADELGLYPCDIRRLFDRHIKRRCFTDELLKFSVKVLQAFIIKTSPHIPDRNEFAFIPDCDQ